MPVENRFRPQPYRATVPASSYRLLAAPSSPPVESPEFVAQVRRAGEAYRRAGVGQILLVHGTFVGYDAVGFLTELARLHAPTADMIARYVKAAVDSVTDDLGNYTQNYADRFAAGISPPGARPIPVSCFSWSSRNNHIGRAEGAICLLEKIAGLPRDAGERVLLWGHSHAGNVFALVSNLLASPPELVDEFFAAARTHYAWPVWGRVDIPLWPRVRELLKAGRAALGGRALDIVTFGTPVRYGWDSDGLAKVLHFIHHRPTAGRAEYLAPFPLTAEHLRHATAGDCIQQQGIAGTDLPPIILAWRTWLADRRLHAFLQEDLGGQSLLARLALGRRVPDEGQTLLVDYGPMTDNVTQHCAGHAVYTQLRWLPFHAQEVAREFYGSG